MDNNMKIGIVTFSNAHNYGAVLQAWSLQTYLEKLGYHAEIVNLRLAEIDRVYRIVGRPRDYETSRLSRMTYRMNMVKTRITNSEKYHRYHNFEHFINHVLHTTKKYNSIEELRNDTHLHYDILIAGSDQIWNSGIPNRIDSAYFLDFGGDNVKRISYAASIGATHIPEDEFELFRYHLKRFDYISVREVNAKESVEQLTEKPVALVADPTFLLEQKDFDQIKKDYKAKKKYIYVHNVHLNIEDEALDSVVVKLAEMTGLPIVSNRIDSTYPNEMKKFLSGKPEEFIGVIANAEYVVTNSFHATVFAITYHRNFITVPHYSNPDRMIYLLDCLGLSSHLIDQGEKIPTDLETLCIDYEAVERKKGVMRSEAQAFLNDAIKGPKTCKVATRSQGNGRYYVEAKEQAVYRDDELLDILAPLFKKAIAGGGKCVLPIFSSVEASHYAITDEVSVIQQAMVPESFETEFDAQLVLQIKELLEQDKPVVFVGNEYRIALLAKQINLDTPNLLTIEIPSAVFAKYRVLTEDINRMQDLYHDKLTGVEFTNQFRHDENQYLIYHFASGVSNVENIETAPLMQEAVRCVNHSNHDYERCEANMLIGRATDFTIDGEPVVSDGCIIQANDHTGMRWFDELRDCYIIDKSKMDLHHMVAKEFHFDQEKKK